MYLAAFYFLISIPCFAVWPGATQPRCISIRGKESAEQPGGQSEVRLPGLRQPLCQEGHLRNLRYAQPIASRRNPSHPLSKVCEIFCVLLCLASSMKKLQDVQLCQSQRIERAKEALKNQPAAGKERKVNKKSEVRRVV